jgi:hypothetical protein
MENKSSSPYERQTNNDLYEPYRIKKSLDYSLIPEPIFEKEPELARLYWKAWQIAWSHVLDRKDTPEHLYIDPAMTPTTTWIWDTCFMVLFCRYAFKLFPGIQSLNNFYYILHDKKPSAAKIHFSDNPPLFAWVEWEYYKMTGDKQRLNWVLNDHRYLEKHYNFIETARKFWINKYVHVMKCAKRHPLGFEWRGNTSGMDNSPRGRNWWNCIQSLNPRGQIGINFIYWVDLIAQQALTCDNISKIANVIDNKEVFDKYTSNFEEFKRILNTYYWNSEENTYFDIYRRPTWYLKWLHKTHRKMHNEVKTLASYWPMLAGICDKEQAIKMAEKVANGDEFGGEIPLPSLSRDDPEFDPRGRYWRGGVWLPTAYMTIKALERYAFYDLADKTAERLVISMLKTYQNFSPHTIWEVYSPTEYRPSTLKRNEEGVRIDFCGWSALGPISLFIENILGFHEINAQENIVKWRVHQTCKHGIKYLQFGKVNTNLIYENGVISTYSNRPYSLWLTDDVGKEIQKFEIPAGSSSFKIQ